MKNYREGQDPKLDRLDKDVEKATKHLKLPIDYDMIIPVRCKCENCKRGFRALVKLRAIVYADYVRPRWCSRCAPTH